MMAASVEALDVSAALLDMMVDLVDSEDHLVELVVLLDNRTLALVEVV